jgi:hypothetical protein
MKKIALLSIGIMFCLSLGCSQSQNKDKAEYTRINTYEIGKEGDNKAVEMKELRDSNSGMINMYIPLPVDWQTSKNAIEGPDGTTIQEFPGGSYNWQQRQINSIDQIIQEDINQLIQNNGAKLLRVIDLPEVEERDKRLGSQYWKAMPMQNLYQTKGVEIRDAEGRPVLLVVHFTQTRSQYGVAHNGYYLHVLTSSDERYEKDKQILRFALANQQSNPEAVLAFNKKMQQEYIRRQRLFDQRMKQAWATFNAWNKNHVETWNDINESSMASWRSQEAMRDAGHANAVDGVLERERVIDPSSGSQLEVDAGYKYYFTNGQGEWIGTNSEFFNPANDPDLNHQEWRRAPIGGDN